MQKYTKFEIDRCVTVNTPKNPLYKYCLCVFKLWMKRNDHQLRDWQVTPTPCSILQFLSYSHTFLTVLKVYLPDYNVGKEGVILPLFLYRKNEVFILIFFFTKIKPLIAWNTCICLKLEKPYKQPRVNNEWKWTLLRMNEVINRGTSTFQRT